MEAKVGAPDLVAGAVEPVAGVCLPAGLLVEPGGVSVHLARSEGLVVVAGEDEGVGVGGGEGSQVVAGVVGSGIYLYVIGFVLQLVPSLGRE